MTEKEKGVIEHANIIIKEGLDKEDDIQGILKKLLNLTQKQQAEIEKKDKMIEELILSMAEKHCSVIDIVQEYICDNRCIGNNDWNCEKCIKQYFEKQVESENKQC